LTDNEQMKPPLGLEEIPPPSIPWAIFHGTEIVHLGLYPREEDCWVTFTGWGSPEELEFYQLHGYRAVKVKIEELAYHADDGNKQDHNPGPAADGD
jgi:hypothetical protein